MRSGLRSLRGRSGPPVPQATRAYRRGLAFDLGGGRKSRETYLRAYTRSGTVFSIVSLLQQAPASVRWHLYHKPAAPSPAYSRHGDAGTDERREAPRHAAIKLWNAPNEFHTGFEFREGSNQHLELTGETFWVVNREVAAFPTALWYVRPDRMEPVPDPDDYLLGWIYHGPNGEQVPLRREEVILEKLPDPCDPFRGTGPVSAILDNIQQQDYATQYQRNLFQNGADPGGIISVPNRLTDPEFDKLVDRWREMHQGVARAGRVGVLEGADTKWIPAGQSNKDLEYGNLRLANRDETREAWRIHKAMLGTVDDVNRANAETAEEIFGNWQNLPRLERRRDTLNHKLLPMFGPAAAAEYEFDFENPVPESREQANAEMIAKAAAAQTLVSAGYDADDALDWAGIPPMGWTQPLKPTGRHDADDRVNAGRIAGLAPREQYTLHGDWNTGPDDERAAGFEVRARKDARAKVFRQVAKDYPPAAMGWMHHASWSGPVKVPLSHIEPMMKWLDRADPAHIQDFVQVLADGGKLKPLLLVKTPGNPLLLLVDGHHRYLGTEEYAEATGEENPEARAFIGVVGSDHGPWETMHDHQIDDSGQKNRARLVPLATADVYAGLVRHVLGDGYVPVETVPADFGRRP